MVSRMAIEVCNGGMGFYGENCQIQGAEFMRDSNIFTDIKLCPQAVGIKFGSILTPPFNAIVRRYYLLF